MDKNVVVSIRARTTPVSCPVSTMELLQITPRLPRRRPSRRLARRCLCPVLPGGGDGRRPVVRLVFPSRRATRIPRAHALHNSYAGRAHGSFPSRHICEASGEEDAVAAGGEEAAGRRILHRCRQGRRRPDLAQWPPRATTAPAGLPTAISAASPPLLSPGRGDGVDGAGLLKKGIPATSSTWTSSR